MSPTIDGPYPLGRGTVDARAPGRRQILLTDAVLDVLGRHRIVTLLGPGGIGKTRLAVNIGSRCGALCPDAVWFADLTRTNDSGAFADVVADAVGRRGVGARPCRC